MDSFYYSHTEDGVLVKKPLSELVRNYICEAVDPALQAVDRDEYWRKHGKWMITAVRSSYFVHDGAAYWALELAPFTVLRFRNNSIEAAELVASQADDVDDDPQYDTIFDSWDDIMERETAEWERCSDEDADLIAECMDWTEALHAEMHARIPIESLFDGQDGE